MKIEPTLEGGLSVKMESDADWMVMALIVEDAGDSAHLAEFFGELMDDDSEWSEWVVPDLDATFCSQCACVREVVEKARLAGESAVLVRVGEAESWYGALNQARLSLQSRYSFDAMPTLEGVNDELKSAYFRDRFYTYLQSLLLEFVFDESA